MMQFVYNLIIQKTNTPIVSDVYTNKYSAIYECNEMLNLFNRGGYKTFYKRENKEYCQYEYKLHKNDIDVIITLSKMPIKNYVTDLDKFFK
jgi:hypothetical protein